MIGKRLGIETDEEIRQQDKMDNSIKAIVLFQNLDKFFSDIKIGLIGSSKTFEVEISREYNSLDKLFKDQCANKKKSDPTFDIEVYAQSEKERIEGILEQVRQLSDKSYYSDHKTYIQALKYIKHLTMVTNVQFNKTDIINKKYEIKKTDLFKINDVYGLCNNVIFECTFSIFLQGIEAANFTKIKINKQNIFQEITYRITGIMPEEWYDDIIKNMGWDKRVVSGRALNLTWTKKLDIIPLPRPKKE
jgi:hypothetical protein